VVTTKKIEKKEGLRFPTYPIREIVLFPHFGQAERSPAQMSQNLE